MNVELAFKPIYKPLFSELLAISLSSSDTHKLLYDYYVGKARDEEIKMTLERIVKGKYLLCVEKKCIGDSKIKGEETIIPMITKNKKLNLRVVVT